ncbi:sphingomyelin phosphodiesterase 4-like [Gigantopelta aegis]|uniref:sphingomyelin phosphodiesterase 4-like n=1 Tax=Gigantopelta aegis TaxID=1735272 RepID=UPI001B8880E4|nr:sphingomyelin phosphodiesterase 4-like [Gigantopelta aegis]
MAAIGGPGVLLQLQSIFTKRLPQRCQEVEDLIRKTSIKELKNCLPYIVESIFGYGAELGWDLDKISKYQNPHEFHAVRRFLAPESQFLNLIYNLQADTYLQYEFQLNHLPAPSRHLIEEGAIPMFYINKLRQDGFGQTYLALGAFEYFMFHFAYYVVNPSLQSPISWVNFYDYLYPNLVDDYMHYFLPLDKKMLPPMPHMPTSVRCPAAQYTIPGGLPPSRTSPSPQHQRTRPTLFKTSFTAMQKQHVQGSPVLEQGEAETWRSETMLQVFAEFWLNQNSYEIGRLAVFSQASVYSTRYVYERDPFYYLFEHFMPTQNHAKIVRCLIKYLHYFINSASDVITSPYHHSVPSPLDVFKRTTVPQIIQKKLYAFLRHAFDKWPLDSSFKWVLEAWLSYIQPWRYVDPRQLLAGKEHDAYYTTQEKRVDDKWDQFIEDNLLFYTVLFQRFLPRVYRFDLTSYQSANMLFRVTKVLSLPNLAGLIFKAEREMFGSSFHPSHLSMSTDIGNSYLSTMPPVTMPLPPQLIDFEQPSFQYQPMFGEVMSRTIQDLIQLIMQAYHTVQVRQLTAKPKGSGFFSWLSDVFAESNPFASISSLEQKRTVQHLQMSMKNFAEIFKLPLPAPVDCDLTFDPDTSSQTSYLHEPEMPDSVETEHGPELTDLGKYQIINGLRKFDISLSGDPDLQPVKSYENAVLVRMLHQFCSFVNFQFGENIKELYNRQDLVGGLAKVFFSPPIAPCHKITSPISKQTAEVLRQPRLSLRFLASYSTIMYLTLLFLFLRFWIGIGPVRFLFLLVILVMFYGLIAAIVRTNSVKQD